MQQRTHRAIFSHSLLKAIFSETNGEAASAMSQ